jgi:hypothetical protein
MKQPIEFKENDVFEFKWNKEQIKARPYPYHCFDGTLIAKKSHNGDILLVDTYWSTGDCKYFTTQQALEKGELTFLCNLDEFVDIEEWKMQYYDDSDIVVMYIHAGHRNRFLLKKGAVRSQAKMIESINQKIENEHSEIKSAERRLKGYYEALKKIESGDTSVYI